MRVRRRRMRVARSYLLKSRRPSPPTLSRGYAGEVEMEERRRCACLEFVAQQFSPLHGLACIRASSMRVNTDATGMDSYRAEGLVAVADGRGGGCHAHYCGVPGLRHRAAAARTFGCGAADDAGAAADVGAGCFESIAGLVGDGAGGWGATGCPRRCRLEGLIRDADEPDGAARGSDPGGGCAI